MSEEPGKIKRFIRSTLGFRKSTLTALVVVSYVVAILINLYFDKVSLTPPEPTPRILGTAWLDLQSISTHFHPFTSHANDEVHKYLVERVTSLSAKKEYVEFDDDYNKLKFIINQPDVFDPESLANRIIYFESSNVVVKIEGKDPSLPGVLVSAHYDSVPTAYGTTDDGMGIASILGILEHYSSDEVEQPERTIILNFNNDEEFGLLGAEAFVKHKWFNLVKYFVNLEGTGAGGKAILFRSTDVGVLSYYSAAKRPFANSLFQQGFQSGLIRSQTDYKIYTENGLRGVDIAFFKPRSLYHTMRDSIAGTTLGSLWHMESNALSLVDALANEKDDVSDDTSAAVFFDVLGIFFFYCSVNTLYVLDILIVSVVPVVTILCLFIVAKRGTWYVDFGRGWLRYPISLGASYALTSFVSSYIYLNDPILLSNDYISPLLALSALNLLSNYVILNFAAWARPVHDQKLICLLELNILLWIGAIWMTSKEKNEQNVAGYSITLVHLLVSASSIFGLTALMIKKRAPRYKKVVKPRVYGSTEDEQSTSHAESPAETIPESSDSERQQLLAGEESSINNNSTIVVIEHESEETYKQKLKHAALQSFSYDWSIQFLLLVPLAIYIIFSNGELILQALNQTVQESSYFGKVTMHVLVGVAVWLGVPVTPFIHKLNAALVLFLAAVLLVGSTVSYFETPYSYANPLKLRFLETVNTATESSLVSLSGRAGYIEPMLRDIPSLKDSGNTVSCKVNSELDTEICQYEGPRPYLLDGTGANNKYSNYLNVKVINNSNDGDVTDKYTPVEVDFVISAQDNRNCILTFNSSHYNPKDSARSKKVASPVKLVTLYQNGTSSSPLSSIPSGYSLDERGNHRIKTMKGIDEIQLHKLNWTQPHYRVGIQWLRTPFDDDEDPQETTELGLNVRCYWGEYDESVLVDGEKTRKVPALDELIQYSPRHIIYSNLDRGLVEVEQYLTL
ncbi:hypothetical protein OGAPHI_006223 [Ogataea philodendri]|uniref:Peptide hydrolase n=1 Tax=Ogataea philodendri TaxID=1378263 RepID=A0A9P8NYS0_9ASCO|nr:uncharacterized protein OGAPHI_006223 [Ogataea philodendri]KAH3662042.1 hypothetical protein OGAPHI_006223 [Ogataea philodendri]